MGILVVLIENIPFQLTAKNIIIFVGADMSQLVVAAARKYKGSRNTTFIFENFTWRLGICNLNF
jgi:hypothetical protein